MDAPRLLLAPANVEAAAKAQAELGLCDACLGRRFGKVETGLTNPERGRIVREAAAAVARQGADASADASSGGARTVPVAECWLCEGLLGDLDALAQAAVDALAPYEHRNFLVGTRVDPAIERREADANALLGITTSAERIQSELNREVGKRVSARIGKPVEFKQPDLTVVLDTRFLDAELQHGGLLVFGRYRKLTRDLPQTKWPCRRCQGTGCVDCDGTGKQYATSVEELVGGPFLAATGATDESFHGAGREDIDARCIGRGRPFILELKDPRVRALDLEGMPDLVKAHADGRVEIEGLRLAPKSEIAAIKEHRGAKTYRASVRFERPVPRAQLEAALERLRGATIEQRTPQRVEHRRADLVRGRQVLGVDVESADELGCALRIRGDAGLYIKELVSGDDGRTEPSLAGLLGVPAKVDELDIVDVEYEPPADAASV